MTLTQCSVVTSPRGQFREGGAGEQSARCGHYHTVICTVHNISSAYFLYFFSRKIVLFGLLVTLNWAHPHIDYDRCVCCVEVFIFKFFCAQLAAADLAQSSPAQPRSAQPGRYIQQLGIFIISNF